MVFVVSVAFVVSRYTGIFCRSFKGLFWDSPDPRQGPESHFLEKRVSRSKNPHFPSPLQRLEKGVFGPKIPFFYVCPCRKKRGFFDRKLPFPERGEMGVFGPRNPLFQEMGIRAPVWGWGNPKGCFQILILWFPCFSWFPVRKMNNDLCGFHIFKICCSLR